MTLWAAVQFAYEQLLYFYFFPLPVSFSSFSLHFNVYFNEVKWFLDYLECLCRCFTLSSRTCPAHNLGVTVKVFPVNRDHWPTCPGSLGMLVSIFSLLWNSLLLVCQSDTKFRSMCKRAAMRNGKLNPLTSFLLFKYDFVWPRCSDWWFGFQVWLEMQGLVTVPKLGLWKNISCSPSKEKLL